MPRSWIEKSPYTATLGIALESISEEAATLVLPFKDENSNPGRALHGGCAASLAIAGAQALARTAQAPPPGAPARGGGRALACARGRGGARAHGARPGVGAVAHVRPPRELPRRRD